MDVPDLRTLRATAGEATASPELVIEAMLRERQPPAETECLVCGVTSGDVCYFQLDCERPDTAVRGWRVNPYSLF